MSDRAVALVAVALLAPVLAGCVATGPDLPLTALSTEVQAFSGSYTWRTPVVHGADGSVLSQPDLLDAARLPVAIQTMLPGIGGEPTLGVSSKGTIMAVVFDRILRSTDQGRTWEVAVDYVTPGHPVTDDGFTTNDPMMWLDPVTDRVFADQMTSSCTYLQWSDSDGEPGTWTDRPLACGIPGIDHQKLMTAPPGPAVPPPPMPLYPNVLYICMNKGLDLLATSYGTTCVVSLDGGLTFAYETNVYLNDALCSNINGHPAAWPDGTVGLVLGNLGGVRCKRPLTVGLTEDNGLTWQLRQCDPALTQVEIDADLTVTPDGTAYLLYREEDELEYVLRSTDKFQTCTRFRVAPPDHTMNAFAGITSGDDGRIAMAYLGTRDPQGPGAEPSNATGGSAWHLYVTTSYNADTDRPTFVTQQVTPEEDPVQVGCIWMQGGGGGPQSCRNLLDFIDMVHDLDGRFYIAITDGCVPRNGCTGTPEQSDFQSRERQVSVVVQDRGESLFSDRDVLPAIGLVWPSPMDPEAPYEEAGSARGPGGGPRPGPARLCADAVLTGASRADCFS